MLRSTRAIKVSTERLEALEAQYEELLAIGDKGG
jgi:hypothetical protein